MQLKREDATEEHFVRFDVDTKSDKDWTNNKPKAKQLSDSVERTLKNIEQVLKIYQSNLEMTTSNEVKINKILSKQVDSSLRVYLFRRLVRIYFGERICLNDLIQKLQSLIELLNHVKQEMAWLCKTFYEDDNIDKLISVETKMDVFAYMQEAKVAEVCTKVLTIQCICTHLHKQFEIVQILFKDKYPNFQTHASMKDIHSWQQTIRKGSKRSGGEDEMSVPPASPSKQAKVHLSPEQQNTTPGKESEVHVSPYAHNTSPVRSSKK